MAAPTVYRSVLLANGIEPDKLLLPDEVPRPPVSVPNVVDNLWEWARPEGYPSRRFAIFASPTRELAARHGAEGGQVYRVEFQGIPAICQVLGFDDSKRHPECVGLPIFLYERLGRGFLAGGMERKVEAGRLWMPCLAKPEVERCLVESKDLSGLREELRERVRYWDGVVRIDAGDPRIDAESELFFDAPQGYYLRRA